MNHNAVIISYFKHRGSSLTLHRLAAYCLYLRLISEKVASTILEMKTKNIHDMIYDIINIRLFNP